MTADNTRHNELVYGFGHVTFTVETSGAFADDFVMDSLMALAIGGFQKVVPYLTSLYEANVKSSTGQPDDTSTQTEGTVPDQPDDGLIGTLSARREIVTDEDRMCVTVLLTLREQQLPRAKLHEALNTSLTSAMLFTVMKYASGHGIAFGVGTLHMEDPTHVTPGSAYGVYPWDRHA